LYKNRSKSLSYLQMAGAAEPDYVQESLNHILNFPGPRDAAAIRAYTALNKKINRLDIEKDAKATTPVDTMPPYTTAMAELFKGVDATNYMNKLKQIEKSIFDDTSLGPKGKKHSWLKKPSKSKNGYSSSFMPEHIKHVYHDSGYNPRDIIAEPITWITPGSFIDPAGRDKPGMHGTRLFPDGPITIGADYFSHLGFPGITFIANISKNECYVEIDIPECDIINILRNNTFNSISEPPDYFCGNNDKNNAINSLTNDDHGKCEVKRYTISKELSDFTQILFAIINMKKLNHESIQNYAHCIFTTDSVVAARSRLMGMQSCEQDHSIVNGVKDSHRVILRTIELNAANANRELKLTYKNACIKNNNTVTFALNRALVHNTLFLGGERIITVRVRNFLISIMDAINSLTTAVNNLDIEMDVEAYHDLTIKYSANTPINEKGRVVSSLTRLFVPIEGLIDPIYAFDTSNFGNALIQLFSQRGGRFLNVRRRKKGRGLQSGSGAAPSRPGAGVIMPSDEIWDGSSVITQRELDMKEGSSLYRDMYASLDPRPSLEEFEDFIFKVYNYIIYLRETPLGPRLNELYHSSIIPKGEGGICDMTLDDFRGILPEENEISFTVRFIADEAVREEIQSAIVDAAQGAQAAQLRLAVASRLASPPRTATQSVGNASQPPSQLSSPPFSPRRLPFSPPRKIIRKPLSPERLAFSPPKKIIRKPFSPGSYIGYKPIVRKTPRIRPGSKALSVVSRTVRSGPRNPPANSAMVSNAEARKTRKVRKSRKTHK